MAEHRSELVYTNNDDGIWLWCCLDFDHYPHWSANMGFSPSVDQVARAWEIHLEHVAVDADG